MIIFTRHALEKMDGLGIAIGDVKQVVMKGMKWKEEKRGMWHAQMAGIEVVFSKQEDNFVVVTVYLAGRSK